MHTVMHKRAVIVGAGNFCQAFLKYLVDHDLWDDKIQVLGVADKEPEAKGLLYAAERGVFTTTDYMRLFELEGIQVVLEFSNDPHLADTIRKQLPGDVRVIDHFEARSLWDMIQIESVKKKGLAELSAGAFDLHTLRSVFEKMSYQFATIVTRRNERSREIEQELIEHERTLSQIIQGSTIPTFVINQDHKVSHWNRALERLTGYRAEEMVGTDRQWAPFYSMARPTMADVILDQVDKDEIEKLYGSKWQPSAWIEGAYEAEDFFPGRQGAEGKWLFFTAAPIHAPDGTIIGAIETLWDKTEDKRAEKEREQHTWELRILLAVYTALNASLSVNERIQNAIREVMAYLEADDICILLRKEDGSFEAKYSAGVTENTCLGARSCDCQRIALEVAEKGEFTICREGDGRIQGADAGDASGPRILAFIPFTNKSGGSLGVIRIGSSQEGHLNDPDHSVLDLIGNRIGVAIENAMLQDRVAKSEEKYRSLFNNNPNPIFIMDGKTLTIVDTNQRAQDVYGYSRQEFAGMPFAALGEANDVEMIESIRHLGKDRSILFSKKRHYTQERRPFFVNIYLSRSGDEPNDVLIASTTDISETIEKETQLIQAAKLTTLGVMAAGMAHEINQPLNVIQLCADFFLKSIKKGKAVSDEDLSSMAGEIIANVNRATNVIKHVRAFARQSEINRNQVDINAPIQDVFKVLGHQLKVHQIELVLDLASDIPYIFADHNRLEQVFINLVTNAIDAMDEKAKLPEHAKASKRLTIRSWAEGGSVWVSVADTGMGMPEDVLQKIFTPFFTTKETGKGTGLGTSISYGIVKDYNGTIHVESQHGQGTTFTLRFPAGPEKKA